jgi:DNA-directed RNA polymerase subunit M/transcription elongation factor TFIIS
MVDQDDFCPECKSILNPVEMMPEEVGLQGDRKGLYMRCDDCNFSRPAESFSTTHFTKRIHQNKKGALNMDPVRVEDLIFDKTYQVTNNLPCVNKDCPSRKTGKNPPVVLVTSDQHPELGYLCSECKSMWGKF